MSIFSFFHNLTASNNVIIKYSLQNFTRITFKSLGTHIQCLDNKDEHVLLNKSASRRRHQCKAKQRLLQRKKKKNVSNLCMPLNVFYQCDIWCWWMPFFSTLYFFGWFVCVRNSFFFSSANSRQCAYISFYLSNPADVKVRYFYITLSILFSMMRLFFARFFHSAPRD